MMKKLKLMTLFIIISIGILSFGGSISDEVLEIAADKFEVDTLNNQFIAKDKIKITQGKLIIYASQATYTKEKEKIRITDKVRILYDQILINCETAVYNRNTYKIVAEKDLSVIFQDYVITSKRLVYDIKKGLVFFEGDTTISRKKNIINGKDIILDIGLNKIYSNEKTKFIIEEVEK
ncbi:MAG: hypothetical protein A2Y40_01910 [Candidatus Margulisbacteria bacterium GWF2_35_9]|nr:MAG: hypothetical protein A2Y40_01910 [Candidatus Margulisbacteria bacterium GWF2_35_9]